MRKSPLLALLLMGLALCAGPVSAAEKRLAYLVSDLRIPFWEIMWRGIDSRARASGYQVTVHSAENNPRRELEFAAAAIAARVDGIILSPTNSSAAVTILQLANEASIPVVIADIGTDSGEYVSYIASDNREGSYQLGKLLARELQQRKWEKGSVGIIAIPQKRTNGRERTAGFMRAMSEAGIRGAGIHQQVTFSYQETYDFAKAMLAADPQLRAIWLQGSDRYQAALDAIAAAGRSGKVLLLCFDAEPEFMRLIPDGTLVAAGMQQPFLMGEEAVNAMAAHLQGKPVKQHLLLPVLAIHAGNIRQMEPTIRRNVLGTRQ